MVEVSMTDLHEAGDRRHTAKIDGVGWVFAALVVAITAIAGMVAYYGNGAMVASSPVAHVTASR
jgi:hypothetical protein